LYLIKLCPMYASENFVVEAKSLAYIENRSTCAKDSGMFYSQQSIRDTLQLLQWGTK